MTRRAEFRRLKPGASKIWWEHHLKWDEIERRAQAVGAVYWGPASEMPLELFAYLREASLCFELGHFLATVSLSGALVEVVLNKDARLNSQTGLRRQSGWITLNNKNLLVAGKVGLPVDELVESGEALEDKKPVRFVKTRNKIAHGDISGYDPDLPEQSEEWEREAYDQVAKASRFLVTWFNTS